jgi:hypothetical protein
MEPRKDSSPPKLTKALRATILAFVLALLAAVAIPNFIPARLVMSMNTCVFNQMWIESAKRQWASENHKSAHDIPSDTEILAYLRKTPPMWNGSPLPPNLVPRHVPVCVFSHRAYTIGSVSQPVRCDELAGHQWNDHEYRFHYGLKGK